MTLIDVLVILLTSHALDANKIDDSKNIGGDFYRPDIEKFCNLEVSCDGVTGSRIPVQLPRGRDGTDGNPGPRGPPGPPGMPGPSGSTSRDVQPSAFMVSQKKHLHAKDFSSETEVLVYDTLITSVGEDYNMETGKYTAPRNGTYFFSLTFAAHKWKEAAGTLYKDGDYIGRVWVISRPSWTSASSSFTLHLTRGESVWVKPIKEANEYYGNSYCTFSGHVLFYD